MILRILPFNMLHSTHIQSWVQVLLLYILCVFANMPISHSHEQAATDYSESTETNHEANHQSNPQPENTVSKGPTPLHASSAENVGHQNSRIYHEEVLLQSQSEQKKTQHELLTDHGSQDKAELDNSNPLQHSEGQGPQQRTNTPDHLGANLEDCLDNARSETPEDKNAILSSCVKGEVTKDSELEKAMNGNHRAAHSQQRNDNVDKNARFTEKRAAQGGLKILALTTPVGNASQSHFYILTKLAEELVSRGNQVTMPLHKHMKSRSRLVEVLFYGSSLSRLQWYRNTQGYMRELVFGNITVEQISSMLYTNADECDTMLGDVVLHTQLQNRHFDVAIVDNIFNCGFLYAKRLNIPVIGLECATLQSTLYDMVDPHPLAYVPVDMTGLTDKMTFLQRLRNTATYYMYKTLTPTIIYPPFDRLTEKYNIGQDGQSAAEVVKGVKSKVKLWIVNQCWALVYPRPLLPSVVMAGGMLTRPANLLPESFQKIYDEAGEAGVIVVSFGSYLSLEHIPALERELLEGLSRLPQTVIYAARHAVTDLPSNIRRRNYIPQNDLLGHPKTRAAVVHGGMNGVYEAVYHAVPTLVIPTGFDAIDNAVRMRDRLMARVISPYDVTADRVHAAMMDLVTDENYKTNARRVSAIFRDQPQLPLEKAAFWVEHVMRHVDTDENYLRAKGSDLPWWKLANFDIYGTFMAVVFAFVAALFKAMGFCIGKCRYLLHKVKFE